MSFICRLREVYNNSGWAKSKRADDLIDDPTDDIMKFGILHIRKCGGTALRKMLHTPSQIENDFSNYIMFDHFMSLRGLWRSYPNHRAIFVIRDPLTRFVSGFNGRLRQGKPTFSSPWTKLEAEIFKTFKTPNMLAEALSSNIKSERLAARLAILSIRHVDTSHADWLHSVEFLNKNIVKIAFIADLDKLDTDIVHIKNILQIDSSLTLPKTRVGLNAAPKNQSKELSALAIKNLRKWYKKDEAIMEWCRQWRKNSGFE